jgi:hypothetical protein
MNMHWIEIAVLLCLGLAVLGAVVRGRRRGLFVLLQVAMAVTMYFCLFPPLRDGASHTLTILNQDWALAHAPDVGPIVVLPEATRPPEHAERAPDLATALRRHPEATRLHLVGRGLSARDLPAVGDRSLEFSPAPAMSGVVWLRHPQTRARGGDFQVQGQVQGLAKARVELRDPADALLAQGDVGSDGRFDLHARMRVAGTLALSLRLLDEGGQVFKQMPLPVRVIDAKPARVWILSGATNPELKYLRRWARDAGLDLHTRTQAGAGVVLGDGARALDVAQLHEVDALLLDARQVDRLSDSQIEVIDRAVRDGLGVLLRLDEPLSARTRQRLSDWGFRFGPDQGTALVQLDGGTKQAPLPVLHRRILMPLGKDWAPLWRDAHGTALGAWRARGRGRIAITGLDDSFQLVLAGHSAQHGALWSQAIAVIARGITQTRTPTIPWPLWQGERASVCGLGEAATIVAPEGQTLALPLDPATGARRCAAFWPEHAGWHVLEQGQERIPFLVWSADTAAAWHHQIKVDATADIATASSHRPHANPAARERGPAWPWFLAWLLLAGLSWRMEKTVLVAKSPQGLPN